MSATQIKIGTFTRAMPLDQSVDPESRTLRFSFSSTQPVERMDWDKLVRYDEVLSHDPNHVNLERVRSGAVPLLWNHDRNAMIGKVVKVELDGDRGYCEVKFSRNKRAQEVFQDVQDGIVTEASFMYEVREYEEIKARGKDKGKPTYRATNWEVFEISLVTIPADHTVGVGRSDDELPKVVALKSFQAKEERTMPDEDLNLKYKDLEFQFQTLRQELTQRDEAIAQRDAQIKRLELQRNIESKCSALRRKAEILMSEAGQFRMSPAEFDSMFGKDLSADVERHLSDDGQRQLDKIEFYLEMAEKRPPIRSNPEIPIAPIPTSPGAIAVDEQAAQRLLDSALKSKVVI